MWKPVPGYEGHYEVSNRGQVWSYYRTGKILAPSLHGTTGYYVVSLHKDGKHKVLQVHALVLSAFAGPSNGLIARHLNGNPLDNRWPENLVWGTYQENADDRIAHGRALRGEKHPQAKLTEMDVAEIRRLKGVLGSRRLAKVYQVDRTLIDMIRAHKVWKHV
jgi:hypothetical protein